MHGHNYLLNEKQPATWAAGRELTQVEVLFQRIDVSRIEEEVQRLKSREIESSFVYDTKFVQ